ncbi:MAG TPA: tRNA (guanosine(46)-N7)-methyltransferase TrmB [Flavobacteriales bacterium]
MGKDKLKKWAENKTFGNVFEPDLLPIIKEGKTFMKGEWRSKFFKNDNPIVLELGCGKGEYTVGLAMNNPNVNYIGVDVKGHRFHKGAKEAIEQGLSNVAFLRTRVEFIESFFDKDEVDEIWLTFSDPQPQDHEGKRRITSLYYIDKYKKFIKPGGMIHIKHDNPDLYAKAMKELTGAGYTIEVANDDIYGDFMQTQPEEMQRILNIRTYYEQMWLDEGRKIKYIRFRV